MNHRDTEDTERKLVSQARDTRHGRGIKAKFQSDLDQVAAGLIHLYKLEFKREVKNLSDPLLRWIDFRLRYIDPVPRRIFPSNKFPKKNLPSPVSSGLNSLARLIQEGRDINGFQSKSITKFNDFSGKRKAKRTDLLWADWGITHLHITDNPVPTDGFFMDRRCSNGESWLLFCLFGKDAVGFVDVRKHEDESIFSDRDLVVTMKESWPPFMEDFRLKGILPSREHFTNDEVASLRRNGAAPLVSIGDEAFLGPGLGLTTAGTAFRVTEIVSEVRYWVNWLAIFTMDQDGSIQKEMARQEIVEGEFSLRITPKGICIYEKNSAAGFYSEDEYGKKMGSLICPDWALTSTDPIPPIESGAASQCHAGAVLGRLANMFCEK